jgi:hypothetical protein
VKFGKKGASDIIGCLPDGRFLAVEAKAPGKKPTKAQREYLERVAADGGLALVVDEVGSLGVLLRRLYPGRG